MVRFTSAMIALHIVQILVWAGFYRWSCWSAPDGSAVAFSGRARRGHQQNRCLKTH